MASNLDIDLVRAFVIVAETGSFTRAGERLLRTQSTISLQIKRLETSLGHRLLERTPRSVALTEKGERFLEYARRIVALNDEVIARVAEPGLEGLVRLGTPEDFATSHLPDVLARFAQAHPRVALEVTCDLTLNLLDGFRADLFDLVLVKREVSRAAVGMRVWREPLVWAAGPKAALGEGPIPLVVSPAPCVYRKRATETLESASRPWRIAYTCASLAGSVAAVQAGLGVAVLPRDMAPPGLRALEKGLLPELPDTEVALIAAASLSAPASRLREHIIRSLERR
jgi:DNA-binding transcriptional LysR family regulator